MGIASSSPNVDKFNIQTSCICRSNAEALMCSECGAAASTEAELKRHVAWIHRGQSEYKCQYCDVMFKTARHLDDHVARHLGFKRYQCPYVRRASPTRGTLYNHMHRFKVSVAWHFVFESRSQGSLTLDVCVWRIQWVPVTDPRFNQGKLADLLFGQFSMKTAWKWRNWTVVSIH